jgi:hypothetical protein
VVSIPEKLLQEIVKKTDIRTKKLSMLMLSRLTPSILSYDASASYVQTVLKDGLNIDVDVDQGVTEIIKELTRLDVIYFFLRRLALPKTYKDRFITAFIDNLAKTSLEGMLKANKNNDIHRKLKELEGVLSRKHQDGKRVTDTTKEEVLKSGPGVKKSRK